MGKVAKPKKREPTMHSRAHRRNVSPPPKDLAVKPAAVDETEYKPWLHNAQNAGISKKKRAKSVSRQQKLRQQKAMEKADANLDKLATKVKDSKARARKVDARRAEWEELNGGAVSLPKQMDAVNAGTDEVESGKKDDGLEVGTAEDEQPIRAGATNDESTGQPDAQPAEQPVEEDEEL